MKAILYFLLVIVIIGVTKWIAKKLFPEDWK